MANDQDRAMTARNIIADRDARYRLFPSDIFDEYAWNMLLHLFVAHVRNEGMTPWRLIGLVNTSQREGQRWLYQLAKDKQIEHNQADHDVVLTPAALSRLREYFDTALRASTDRIGRIDEGAGQVRHVGSYLTTTG